jgi:hypothetical protein
MPKITARYDGRCSDKDCNTEIQAGDSCYYIDGKLYCEEHGEELEE